MAELTIDLGDEASPYPPVVTDEVQIEQLRHWFGKHMTLVCWSGDHSRCPGVCALGSKVVDERPCLCPCHSKTRDRI